MPWLRNGRHGMPDDVDDSLNLPDVIAVGGTCRFHAVDGGSQRTTASLQAVARLASPWPLAHSRLPDSENRPFGQGGNAGGRSKIPGWRANQSAVSCGVAITALVPTPGAAKAAAFKPVGHAVDDSSHQRGAELRVGPIDQLRSAPRRRSDRSVASMATTSAPAARRPGLVLHLCPA